MVRYARSRGSKASNERRFEDATPWHVMRNNMIAAQNKVFQKVDDCVNAVQKTQCERKISTTWAPFDVPENKSEKKLKKLKSCYEISQPSIKDKSKKKKSIQNDALFKVKDYAHEEFNEIEMSACWPSNDWDDSNSKFIKKSKKQLLQADEESAKPKKKKSMQNVMFHEAEDRANVESHETAISASCVPNDDVSNSSVSRKSKKHSFLPEDKYDKPDKRKPYNDCKTETDSSFKMKRGSLKMETTISPNVEADTTPKKRKRERNLCTEMYQEAESNISSRNDEIYCSKNFQFGNECSRNELRNKAPKFERKPNEMNFRDRKREYNTVEFIGGRKVEIYYFDGFPVMKEDWEHLVKLKENMLKNGVPEDEMKAELKLERRRAEKALSRQRKMVCFHCRESGHLLSDCPILNGYNSLSSKKGDIVESSNAEICFKCGSTEHSYLKCKLGEKDNFKFASCFICGEQGHISRQCPENPRGMYPKGGACRACGDVTHLRRDCPKYQEEQQQGAVTLPTLKDEAALEDLEVDAGRQKTSKTVKAGKKVVKF